MFYKLKIMNGFFFYTFQDVKNVPWEMFTLLYSAEAKTMNTIVKGSETNFRTRILFSHQIRALVIHHRFKTKVLFLNPSFPVYIRLPYALQTAGLGKFSAHSWATFASAGTIFLYFLFWQITRSIILWIRSGLCTV